MNIDIISNKNLTYIPSLFPIIYFQNLWNPILDHDDDEHKDLCLEGQTT